MSTPSNISRFSNSIMTPGSSLGMTPAPLVTSTSKLIKNAMKDNYHDGSPFGYKDDKSKKLATEKRQAELEKLLNPESSLRSDPKSLLRSDSYNVGGKDLHVIPQNHLRQSGEIKCLRVDDSDGGVFISLVGTTILYRAKILPRQAEGGNLTVELSKLFNPKSLQTFKIDRINNIPLGFVKNPGDNSLELRLPSVNNTLAIKSLGEGDRLACGFRKTDSTEFIDNCFYKEGPQIEKNTTATSALTTTPTATTTKDSTTALASTPALTTTTTLAARQFTTPALTTTTTPQPLIYSWELNGNVFYIRDGSKEIVRLHLNNSVRALFYGIDELIYGRDNKLILNGHEINDDSQAVTVVDSSKLTRKYRVITNGTFYTLEIYSNPFNNAAIKNFTYINQDLNGVGCDSSNDGSIKVAAIIGGERVSDCFLIEPNYLNPQIGSCSIIKNEVTGEVGQEYKISYQDKYPSTSNFTFEQRLDQFQKFLFKVEFDSKSKSFSIDPTITMKKNFAEMTREGNLLFQVDYNDDDDSMVFYKDSDSTFELQLMKKENGLFEFLFNDGQVTNCSPLTELESIIKPDHTNTTATSALTTTPTATTTKANPPSAVSSTPTPTPSVKINENGIVTITTTPSGLLSEKKLTIKIFAQIVEKYCNLSIENKTKTNFEDFLPNELDQVTNSEQITLDNGNKFNADQLSKNLTLIKDGLTNTTDIENFENLIDSIEKCEPRKTDPGLVGGISVLGAALAAAIGALIMGILDKKNNRNLPFRVNYGEDRDPEVAEREARMNNQVAQPNNHLPNNGMGIIRDEARDGARQNEEVVEGRRSNPPSRSPSPSGRLTGRRDGQQIGQQIVRNV